MSFFDPLTPEGSLMLESFGVAQPRLIQQVLQCASVVKTSAHFRHQLVGNVNGEAAAFDSTVKHMAGVLFALEASVAVLADAAAATKTERSQSSGPKACCLLLEPLCDICGKFFFSCHDVYVPHSTYTVKQNLSNSLNTVIYEFCDRN